MSSSLGLGRTRSIRQPATSKSQLPQKGDAPSRNTGTGRNASPSRLPQVKPLTRSGTTTAATSASAAARSRAGSIATTTAATTASGRSLTGIFSGSNKPAVVTGARRTSPNTTDAHAPSTTSSSTRTLGRAPSIRHGSARENGSTTTSATGGVSRRVPSSGSNRPTSSGGLPSPTAPKSRPLGHARAKSTATTLTATTTLRPPSSNPSSSPKTTLATSSAVTTPLRRRTSTLPSHTRNSSLSTNASATAQAPPQAQPAAQHNRPAFNINQQHYSPLKSHAPKPRTSAYLAPPSPSKLPANLAISAETSRLQTELLQLSLLHREAGAVSRQWHDSARRKLGARFSQVAHEHASICAEEHDQVEARNVAALVRWGKAGELEDKVQVLDQVLEGVWGFSDPAGRYNRVIDGFDVWAERMAALVRARRKGSNETSEHLPGDDEAMFVSDLDAKWKDECAGLVRKLEGWRMALEEIGPAATSAPDGDEEEKKDHKSSLERMLDGCSSLVYDMLAELELMQEIEREARRAEDDWIEKMHKELDIGDHETLDREAALWKMVI